MHKHKAFTIIELLIVILVIAVLVALTIIGYSGISSKAIVASIQSDLTNAKKALLSFQSTSPTNSFPTALSCTNPIATEICIRTGSSNTTLTYNVNNTSNPKIFNLTATSGQNRYWINDSSSLISNPDIASDGIVLIYDAGNPSSYSGVGTTWYDSSGNNRNATLSGVPLYYSNNGGEFDFDGSADYAITPISPNVIYPSFTGSIWFTVRDYPINDADTPRRIISARKDLGSTLWSVGVGISGQVRSMLYDGTTHRYFETSQLLQNKYYNVQFSYDGNTYKLYLNGNLATSAVINIPSLSYGTITIADLDLQTRRLWSGKISYVALYNRALSQSEITQNFNALRGRYGI